MRMIYTRKFSETEYSIGLGGLGEDIKDYMEIMGEMITIGGYMYGFPQMDMTPRLLIPERTRKGDDPHGFMQL
jgi:hypothetical protein